MVHASLGVENPFEVSPEAAEAVEEFGHVPVDDLASRAEVEAYRPWISAAAEQIASSGSAGTAR